MGKLQRGLKHRIMHIRPAPRDEGRTSESVNEIDELLAGASLPADSAENVYVGLARLCSTNRTRPTADERPRAVIVCVDALGPDEFEFFALLKRLHPDCSAFAYGDRRSDVKVSRAVGLGANAKVTLDAIMTAIDDRTSTEASGSATRNEPTQSKHVDDDWQPASDMEMALPQIVEHPSNDREAPPDEGPLKGPARVPWLRYENQPTRRGPKRPEPVPDEVPASQHAEAEEEPEPIDGPLLTKDELQALMGDDISAIAPQQPVQSDSNDYDRGGT